VNSRKSSSARIDVSRLLFYTTAALLLLGVSFGAGLHAGSERNALYQFAVNVGSTIRKSVELTATEAPTLTGLRPTHFLQPVRNRGDGVTINDWAYRPDELILLSGFFDDSNELRLVRRSGAIVKRWPVRFFDVFPGSRGAPGAPATDWNVDTHGALALPDGSVVFNFEWRGLVKIDRCGRIVWTLGRRTHHSVERADAGGFWVPARREIQEGMSPFPPFEAPYQTDMLLRVSEAGEVLAEYSLPRVLYENGLEPVLTATGSFFRAGMDWDQEITHLNKIDELGADLAADFPEFEAGDLALSIRELNMVLVVDAKVSKIKWWKIGPWRRQHDPEFVRGGKILVFNNNIYESIFGPSDFITPPSTPRVSNIVEVDPSSGGTRIVFGDRAGESFLSAIRGKVDVTPGGGLLITEEDGGRVIETDARRRIVWEYVNRYSDSDVAEITEARVYPAGYFTVADWSCSPTAE
jgi:hypothetical protein